MRVVIDTNVLVSAALRDREPEAVILFIVGRTDIEWVVSPEIMTEYLDVLARPKLKLLDANRQEWLDWLQTSVTWIASASSIEFPRDPKDAKFLACALAAGTDYLITGDHDFDEASKILGTTIISVAMFKRLLVDTP